MFSPNHLPDFPPGADKILPPDVWAKLQAIKGNAALSVPQKRGEIHKLMQTVPVEVLDKMPMPTEFEGLPDEVKAKLKALWRDKDMPMDKKKAEAEAIAKTLPPEQQKKLLGY